MVVVTPAGIEVRCRRRLDKAGAFEGMLEELGKKLQPKAEGEGPALAISDCDLSQNKLAPEQFEALFTQLGAHNARVLRFRLFGCPTLNDEVMRVLSDYLRLLSPEQAPEEMHLSDCAICTDGFTTFISAIEETELYPLQPTHGKGKPLYLRLENNYISEAAIQEKVDAGLIRTFNKNQGRPAAEGAVKINLLCQKVGQYQQKQGDPPAPEDAPPPKEVYDKYNQTATNQGAQPWTPGAQPWTPRPQVVPQLMHMMQNSWFPARTWSPAIVPARPVFNGGVARGPVPLIRPLAARPVRPAFWPATATNSTALIRPLSRVGATSVPVLGGPRPGTSVGFNAGKAGLRPAFNAFNSNAGGVGKNMAGGAAAGANGGKGATKADNSSWSRGATAGTAASHADRSRTPVQRNGAGGGKPTQPAAPPPATNTDLPHPWEEHWSDEYGIPYFWNSETGDALWEKPTV